MPPARVADVALDPRSGGADALYTYRADAGMVVGEAVFVPLGNRSALGFVTAVYDATEEELGFAFSQLRAVLGRVEGLAIPEAVVDLCRFVAEETLCSLPTALAAATPPGVRDRLITAWTIVEGVEVDALTPLQQEVLRVMREDGGALLEQEAARRHDPGAPAPPGEGSRHPKPESGPLHGAPERGADAPPHPGRGPH